jgi:hypothetical protein
MDRSKFVLSPGGRISDAFDMFKGRTKRRLSIKEIRLMTEEAWAGKR